MIHTIEDVIRRLDVMKDKAIELHRIRNQYSKLSGKTYDKVIANSLLEDIQAMAAGIANDTQGDEIRTEMEYKGLEK